MPIRRSRITRALQLPLASPHYHIALRRQMILKVNDADDKDECRASYFMTNVVL